MIGIHWDFSCFCRFRRNSCPPKFGVPTICSLTFDVREIALLQ